MNELDGYILRDEIIIGVLACQDDKKPDVINDTVKKIKGLRSKGFNSLEDAIVELRTENGGYHFKEINGVKTRVFAPLGKDTLPNYTRLPIALCKWLGWAEEVNTKSIYKNKSVRALKITTYGKELAGKLSKIPDLRFEDLKKFNPEAIIAFTAYSNLCQLSVAYNCFEDYAAELPTIISKANPIIDKFGLSVLNDDFLFFAYQEAPFEINKQADNLLDSLQV